MEFQIDGYERFLERRDHPSVLWVELPDDVTTALSLVRQPLGLSVEQAGQFCNQLPGPVFRGARADLSPPKEVLEQAGFTCSIRGGTEMHVDLESIPIATPVGTPFVPTPA